MLFAPADHPVLTSSNIAVLALIEGLVAGVMARNKEAVKLATELTESVMSYLHVPGARWRGNSTGLIAGQARSHSNCLPLWERA